MKNANENKGYIWENSYPKNIDWQMKIEPKALYTLLDDAINNYPNSIAMDFLGKEYSYAQIGNMVDEISYSLQKIGVIKGSKVGLFLPNSPYYLIFYYAILKIGGVVVNYNPLYAKRELKYQIEDSETDFMITMNFKMMLEKMAYILENTQVKKVVVCPMVKILPFPKNILFKIFKSSDLGAVPADGRYIKFDEMMGHGHKLKYIDIDAKNDIAVLQYTGGTTGVPKGAMLSHSNLYANTLQTAAWIKDSVNAGSDSQIGVLPFFHVFAMTVIMNLSVHYGLKIIALPKFDIDELMKIIDQKRPTYFPAVPAIYSAIANHKDVDKYDFSSIKFCLSGGAPLPSDTKKLFEKKVKNKCLAEGYGLTEASPVATCSPLTNIKEGSIGVPFPNTIITVVDTEDKKTTMPIGKKGEICIEGPQVMMGYYKNKKATDEVIIDGKLHTGDVGYIDEDGYIFLVDRIKDLILVRGYNVYPRNVEEAIYLHPSVEETIVASVPDKERGETVWAWVKLKDEDKISEKELLEFLKDKLSPIEIPRKIIIKSEPLPKTMVGKLSRRDILKQEGIIK